MKIFLFLIISFIALAFPLSAKLNQGMYLCESKRIMINVEDEILSIYDLGLVRIESWTDVWSHPLAVCSIKDKKNGYAEINSIQMSYKDRVSAIRITQEKFEDYDYNLKHTDSVDVVFYFPNISDNYIQIRMSSGFSDGYEEKDIVNKTCRLRIRSIGSLDFYITPLVYMPFGCDYQYLGVLYQKYYIPYKKDYNTKAIKIEVPFVDDFTFEKYLIIEEYIKYKQEEISWRGLCFEQIENIPLFIKSYQNYWDNRWVIRH